MAAPSGTTWATLNYDCKIGVYVTVAKTNNTTATVTCQVWGWQYGPSTDNYTFVTSNMAMNFSTTTLSTKRTFTWTTKTGSGWATANQQLLGTYTQTYTRGTSASNYSLAAGLYTESAASPFIKVTQTYTIPVKAYTISYNANSGSGAPAAQTKDHGVSLTLSSTKPTRTGYTFLRWNTVQGGTGTNYLPGATYSVDAAATLYAQWQSNYKTPTITNLFCYRSDSSGNASDEDLYGHLQFSWAVETTVYSDNVGVSYTIAYKANNDSAFTNLYTGTLSGTSGNVSYTSTNGVFQTDNTYSILITVADQHGSSSVSSFISSAYYVMDFKVGGKGIAIGGAAMDDNLTIHMNTVFKDNIQLDHSVNPGIKFNDLTHNYNKTVMWGVPKTENGMLLAIEGGGVTIVGGGESAQTLVNAYDSTGYAEGSEALFLGSDSNIELYSNLNNGWSNKKELVYTSGGNLLNKDGNMATYRASGSGSGYNIYDKTTESQLLFIGIASNDILGIYNGAKNNWLVGHDGTATYVDSFKQNANDVLWSGVIWPTDTQTATFNKNVTQCSKGIVLVWSAYVNSAAQNYNWEYTFIPKWHVTAHGGTGVDAHLSTGNFGNLAAKYIYIHNDHLVGHANNSKNGTANGITYTNNYFCLRAVLGV